MKNCIIIFVLISCISSCASIYHPCEEPDYFSFHKVGDTYEVVGDLYFFVNKFKKNNKVFSTGLSTRNLRQGKYSELFSIVKKLPIGTKLKLAHLENKSTTSFNNGAYCKPVSKFTILDDGYTKNKIHGSLYLLSTYKKIKQVSFQ